MSDLKQKLHFMTMIFSHHSSHSGYHRFLDYIPNEPFRCLPFTKLLTGGLKNRLIEQSWRSWYHYNENVLNDEINIMAFAPLSTKHIFHFIYGENSFCYSANYNRKNKIFACSYHWPESWFYKQGEERFKALTDKIRVVDAAIAVSSNLADFLRQYNDNVFCVPHGIDVDFFVPGKFDDRDETLCLFVGNWLRDFETLVNFAQLMSKRAPSIRVEAVTPERNRHLFEGSGIKVFSGISDEELREKYQKASLLIQPLLDCTANNSALEAMACGLPVIATDIGGIRDYLTEECAVFCEQGDADELLNITLDLLGKPDKRRDMAMAARKRAVDLFSWPVVAEQMIDIYNKLS